ncbi:hypothetical protein [Streptomyces sp. NRRL B-1347]|uniref:hypothetical protein n=1 Tax=Streptomyces sp. NRRL B-1347 TaxID=1476877 RepID=UPI00131ECBAB|nr:hypothetical protein [Streptomyces sp. NRRL B-1347]
MEDFVIKRVAVGVAAAALCAFGGGVAFAGTGESGTAPASSHRAAAPGHGPAAGSDVTPAAREHRLSQQSVVVANWFERPRPEEM